MRKYTPLKDKLKEDVEFLKIIHQQLDENYGSHEWNLSDYNKIELERITGLESHDWEESDLAHFIDGMQRVLHLQEVYDV